MAEKTWLLVIILSKWQLKKLSSQKLKDLLSSRNREKVISRLTVPVPWAAKVTANFKFFLYKYVV